MSSPSQTEFKLPTFDMKKSLPRDDTFKRVEEKAAAKATEIKADARHKEAVDTLANMPNTGGRSRRHRRRHKKTKRSTKKRRHTRRR
jgi:hypothetical protein